jgi:flavin-dependent dehydrogenase
VGDSAGHCLPLTAEGIRTALYFGIACGRELRAVLEGRRPIASALTRYDEFHESHRLKFEVMLAGQRVVPRVPPRLLHRGIRAMKAKRFVDWSFGHYLAIAPPSFVTAGPRRSEASVQSSATWGYGRSQSSPSPSSGPRSQPARPASRV